MVLIQKNVGRARSVRVAPGGSYLVLERVYLDQGGRQLKPNDPVESFVIVSPADNPNTVDIHGLRPQDVLFDSPQLDGDWKVDGVGYTLRHRTPPDFMPDQGREYNLEYVFRVLGDTFDVASYEIRLPYTILAGSGVWS